MLDPSACGSGAHLPWTALLDGSADRYDGTPVTVAGWPVTAMEAFEAPYCLLTPEPVCCRGCLPSDPTTCIEVVAVMPVPLNGREVVLRGVLHRLRDDPCGWHYRLDEAAVVPSPAQRPRFGLSRRGLVAAASLLCLPVAASAQAPPSDGVSAARRTEAAAFLAVRPTIDCHSHAGGILRMRQQGGTRPSRLSQSRCASGGSPLPA